VSPTLYVVDGYNVLHALFPTMGAGPGAVTDLDPAKGKGAGRRGSKAGSGRGHGGKSTGDAGKGGKGTGESAVPGDLADHRRWLTDQLTGFAALRGVGVCLVFDAHDQPGTVCEQVPGTSVEVCYAGGRFTADTLIARRVAERSADTAVIVVSADQEVQRTATRAGVRRMTPRELGLEIGTLDKKLAMSEKTSRIPSTLEDKVDLETWEKLERLRTEGE
jgi:predicted RNA-binding protein with PIN domain